MSRFGSVSAGRGRVVGPELILVDLFQRVVLPHDEGLAAQPAEELLHFRLLARAVDPLRDQVANALERLLHRGGQLLEFEDLDVLAAPDWLGHFTRLHLGQQVVHRRGDFLERQRSDQPAVGLGR